MSRLAGMGWGEYVPKGVLSTDPGVNLGPCSSQVKRELRAHLQLAVVPHEASAAVACQRKNYPSPSADSLARARSMALSTNLR